ncbi:ZYRO0E05698p [Zygosaccharomyces rouxii]|uniref:ZYRO0E05698p n=1 Tax=Zygosaccharomyces rouxii (strain ATCC 2623 / CBS 732 / NBRC 1130 / NCYC 568 / NRRL Y-229) TaxID=559307 RepID=C5E4G2_ZYGRC|nr:uncharacterized protein ZYRO0E05698g [Zygosaccharomyces rouxii]KAH9198219.1 hypothetical protein LQ764DRAFT_211599 [Zygosaccharomyces rouxii]CAR30923.1 ZYRO0E05698p [Zygosaccharomyces rouxii]
MDEILSRHRKESKDLQNRITGMKKQATKSTRKQVMAKCNDLEQEMKQRHELEIKEFNGEMKNEDEEVTPEKLLEQLSIDNDTQKTTESTSAPTPAPTSEPKKRRNRQKERLAKRDAEIVKMKQEAEEEASKQPDLKKIEQDSLDQLCNLNHLMPHDIKPDGHCLFASILDQLTVRHGIKDLDIYKLRQLACNYIRSHSDDFIPYLFDENTMQLQNINEYTDEMEKTAKWGGEIEILALSKVFDCPISILMSGRATHIINEAGEKPELKLIYYKHSYALGEHYNSLHNA